MPKRNRKKVHHSRYLTINNEEIEVNASNKFGVFVPILERMFGQLDISFRIHKRVHVVLFILQHRETSQDNKDISKFMNVLIQWKKQRLNLITIIVFCSLMVIKLDTQEK
jgi:hypothetical protein